MEQFVCLSHAGGLYFCDVICAQRYWQDADPYQQNHFGMCSLIGPLAVLSYVGAMWDKFLAWAKSNHFSALKQSGNNLLENASCMGILGKYHSRDIHKWTGEDVKDHKCPWHPQMLFSCGKCDEGGLGSGVSGRAESVGGGATVSAGSGPGSYRRCRKY